MKKKQYQVQMRKEVKKRENWKTIGEFDDPMDAQYKVDSMLDNNGTARVVKKLPWLWYPLIGLVAAIATIVSFVCCVVILPFTAIKTAMDFLVDFICDQKRKHYERD